MTFGIIFTELHAFGARGKISGGGGTVGGFAGGGVFTRFWRGGSVRIN